MEAYEYIETEAGNSFTAETNFFSLKANTSPKIILIRSLVGAIKFRNCITDVEFVQDTDYFNLNGENTRNVFDRISSYISDDISVAELNMILGNKKFSHENYTFFQNLNNEFNNFHYYQHKNSHTTAFTYIYRILEKISYAFPLVYATKTMDFIGTFDFLKKFIISPNDGELGFYKKFINEILNSSENAGLLKSTIDIDILAENDAVKQVFYNSFIKACGGDSKNKIINLEKSVPYSKIAVNFSEFSSFIISLRNRFFHFLNTNQGNLSSSEILDADSFFKLVNNQSAYWISFVLFEIFKYNIDFFKES